VLLCEVETRTVIPVRVSVKVTVPSGLTTPLGVNASRPRAAHVHHLAVATLVKVLTTWASW
jgi:hypothetical protein